MRPVRIAGTGSFVPPTVRTAADLDRLVSADPGWTARHTGVLTRHVVDGETTAQMAAEAVRRALDAAGCTLDDIDVLVSASSTPQQLIPCTASFVLDALDRPEAGIPAFDVNATCLGFVVGLDLLGWPVAGGRYRRAVLVASEIASIGLDYRQKESAALFGDGAAAVVIERDDSGAGILSAGQEMYPEGADLCEIAAGGTAMHPNHPDVRPRDFLFRMHGPGLYAMALDLLPPFLDRLFAPLDFGLADCDLVIAHQASLPALELMRQNLGIAEDRFWVTADRVGNTIAASIPMGLDDAVRAGRVGPGDTVALIGTSAGFAVGGAVIRL